MKSEDVNRLTSSPLKSNVYSILVSSNELPQKPAASSTRVTFSTALMADSLASCCNRMAKVLWKIDFVRGAITSFGSIPKGQKHVSAPLTASIRTDCSSDIKGKVDSFSLKLSACSSRLANESNNPKVSASVFSQRRHSTPARKTVVVVVTNPSSNP
jgi:hypothetical protein